MNLLNGKKNGNQKLNEVDPKTLPKFMSDKNHVFSKNSLFQLPLPILKNMAIVIISEIKKNNANPPSGFDINNVDNWTSKMQYVNFLDKFGMKIGTDENPVNGQTHIKTLIHPPDSDQSEEANNLRKENLNLIQKIESINNDSDNEKNKEKNQTEKLLSENEKLKLEIEKLKSQLESNKII